MSTREWVVGIYRKAESSRLARSIVTNVTSGTVTQATTPVGSQTYQVRITSTLSIWVTFGMTAVTATANSDNFVPANKPEYFTVAAGQCLGFISTSTSSGYVALTEMS
jgi:hypothetical protein